MNDEASPDRGSRITTQRTEKFSEQIGEQLGRQVGRLYTILSNLGASAESSAAPVKETVQATELTERAEQLVNQGEHLLGEYTTRVYHGIRRIAARAKEEYDDITAEARALEQGGAEPTQQRDPSTDDPRSSSGQA